MVANGIAEQPLSGHDRPSVLTPKPWRRRVMSGNLDEARALLIQGASSRLVRGMVALCSGDWPEARSVLEAVFRMQLRSGARERQVDQSFWYARLLRVNRGAGTRQRLSR